MQIEIDGYIFDITVKHYEPAIPGDYNFFTDNDMDFYGIPAEVCFDVGTLKSEYHGDKFLTGQEKKEVIYEYYPTLYNEILKALEAENSVCI